jgi:hypothetical protein
MISKRFLKSIDTDYCDFVFPFIYTYTFQRLFIISSSKKKIRNAKENIDELISIYIVYLVIILQPRSYKRFLGGGSSYKKRSLSAYDN